MEIKGNRGILQVYGLTEWWNENFSDREKILLSREYTMKYDSNYLGIDELDENILTESNVVVFYTTDDIHKINFNQKAFLIQQSSVISFLRELSFCVKRKGGRSTIDKINKKIEELIPHENLAIVDIHFYFMGQIGYYYSGRDLKQEFYEKMIYYCKKQIEIAPMAAKAFSEMGSDGFIPSHTGYKRLAIILEKEKKYEEAIYYCKLALSQGWNGDWESRINRCLGRFSKLKK